MGPSIMTRWINTSVSSLIQLYLSKGGYMGKGLVRLLCNYILDSIPYQFVRIFNDWIGSNKRSISIKQQNPYRDKLFFQTITITSHESPYIYFTSVIFYGIIVYFCRSYSIKLVLLSSVSSYLLVLRMWYK